jgi:hypothetical protein
LRSEAERVRGRTVEPVDVVDGDEQRLPLRRPSEQAERRGPDREAIVGAGRLESERAEQRRRLVLGQLADVREQRAAELQQPGELELRLRLHAGRPHDVHRLGPRDRVTEQRCLPHSSLAVDDEHRAAAPAS